MKKKTKAINAHHFFKNFIVNGFNLLTIVSCGILLVAVYLTNFHVDDFVVFPNHPDRPNFQIFFYNDSIDNGNSVINHSEVSDSAISVSFVLKEGFVRPYIGIIVVPSKQGSFDLSRYNQIQLEISGENSGNMVVYLITQSTRKKVQGRFPDCYYGCNVNIPATNELRSIAFDQLKIPDWWFDVNNFPPSEEIAPDWRNVVQLSITTGLTPAVEVQRAIHIRAIRFSRNNFWAITALCLTELFVILALMLVQWARLKRTNRNGVITIAYKPIELLEPKTDNADFLEYIHAHFNNSELSLDTVSTACNVNSRRIASSILETYGCNFKSYINQIRINEAKRLMLETDLNISEIAYKVGFNSPNHFNRVFKALTGNNPSGFINQKD